LGTKVEALKIYYSLTFGGTANLKAACLEISNDSTLIAGFHDDKLGSSKHFVVTNDPRHLGIEEHMCKKRLRPIENIGEGSGLYWRSEKQCDQT
jgi:hypothetical protein